MEAQHEYNLECMTASQMKKEIIKKIDSMISTKEKLLHDLIGEKYCPDKVMCDSPETSERFLKGSQ